MSNNNGKLSAKEREILERQRRLAASLKPPPPAAASSASAKPSSVAPVVVDLTQEKPAPASIKPVQKRPTKKRPASAAAIMASARAKAGSTATSSATHASNTVEHHLVVSQQSKQKRPSPKVQRKVLSTDGKTSSLAKLVQNISASTTALDDLDRIPTIEPEDFWKHLRDWDFVSQYATLYKNGKDDDDLSARSHQPLPNVFVSARHYTAAWAPLQLAECRAQLLQEASQNISTPVEVRVKLATNVPRRQFRNRTGVDAVVNWTQLEHETACHVQISTPPGTTSDLKFITNDLVLLMPRQCKDFLSQLAQGTAQPPKSRSSEGDTDDSLHAYRMCGMVGHTEASYRGVNGLVLKVSKRQWAKIGQAEMCLVKLGSNVTALREFTALCRVDTLPMKRYLLGQQYEDPQQLKKLSRHQSTRQLLDVLGGSQALGQGFLEYCRNKFNASQLTSIAASAHEYGDGGFTLIKGPPGTGKTTTLVAVLNSLHIRQYNKYYEEVRRIAAQPTGARQAALEMARKAKPRLLVCAPSNAAVDNVILKIMEDGFIDGQGNRYNPSMIRVGVGKSDAVGPVALETKVDEILSENLDVARLETSIAGFRLELSRITQEIARLRRRVQAIATASPWPLSRDWEIRIDEETFDETGRVYFVNHKDKSTSYEVPPPPEPGEAQFAATAMPEYRSFLSRVVKLVERYFSVKTSLERCTIVKSSLDSGANNIEVRMNLETHILNSVHMIMTTLGTSGNRTLEAADKFEVVVVDEAAQCVEPAMLSALQLGSRHAVLVGDPQQLPATIFNVSGRNSKYDRSLFQRLEEAGQPVYMLNEQYRMHPAISYFPRNIFYKGQLLDGPNVLRADYGNPMRSIICNKVKTFQPFVILDLDSREERGGTSLSNKTEAQLAVYLYQQLKETSRGLLSKSRVAVITPYAQQAKLLRRSFENLLGPQYANIVEVNTVDAFQGREANVVIFSAVRAAGSHGIGFLSDVRRMNVALTRAKHFLFVIARCQSIVINPYWKELVQHARESKAVLRVPIIGSGPNTRFGDIVDWKQEAADPATTTVQAEEQKQPALDPRKRKRT